MSLNEWPKLLWSMDLTGCPCYAEFGEVMAKVRQFAHYTHTKSGRL